MFYQRFTFRLIAGLLLINLCVILLVYLVITTRFWFTISGLAMFTALMIYTLYGYMNQLNQDIKRFRTAVNTRDHTLAFSKKAARSSFPELYVTFEEILRSQKNIQLEQDAFFQLTQTILQQIPAGIIVLKENQQDDKPVEISLLNTAAADLLQTPSYTYWHRLAERNPEFAAEVEAVRHGGKRFVALTVADKMVQLSLEVVPLQLYQHNYSIIYFQNIKDEIESKESEAWNRLVGVISHEILNSITPISSLSDTVNSLIADKQSLNAEDLEDIRPAIQTIRRRSEGLLDFVKDYRLIAELPAPDLKPLAVGETLQHIKVLMQPFAAGKQIRLQIEQTSAKITFSADLKLVEQALINLVTNSIHALEGIKDPHILIDYKLEGRKVYITVTDNGKGITAEHMDKIFVPFFSTRNQGSGIGLTITRNIMKMHSGTLEVSSVPFQQTSFTLVFNAIEWKSVN
ncbi:sensor histidine kinase [Pedobacter antarcticus]|uniref:sensor histidine kinase n=1 Tax=Pedobacter antarcticus TaxID=34086 RepID=UPI001C560E68|nr:ATP-binding protein [Pedobacter antarcticus]